MTTFPNYLLIQLEDPNIVPHMERSGGMKDTLFKADVDKISVRSFKRTVTIVIISHVIFLINFPATEIFVLFLVLPFISSTISGACRLYFSSR